MTRRAAALSQSASQRIAGIVEAEAAELSAEFVPEDVGARVGGHLVDFDRGAIGIDRDPAYLDDRGPGRDLEPFRLGRQRHPGADVLAESRGRVAEVGEAGVDAAGAGLSLGDRRVRGNRGRKPGSGQQDGLSVQDVAAAAEHRPGPLLKAEQCADMFGGICLGDLYLIDDQVTPLGLGAPD